jgi:hypothetical protein
MPRKPRYPDASLKGSLNDIFGTFDQSTIDYLGKWSRMGLQQDLETTRELGPQFQQLRQQMLEADPLIKRLRGVAIGGLQGLQNGALPGDIQRSIENRVRQGQLARGIEDSPFSVGQEAAALMGGSEAIRQQRLNQALAVAGPFNAAGPMLSGGVPNFGQAFDMRQQGMQMQNQQAEANNSRTNAFYGTLGKLAGVGASAIPGVGPFLGAGIGGLSGGMFGDSGGGGGFGGLTGMMGGGGGGGGMGSMAGLYNQQFNGTQPFMDESWRFQY